VSSLALYIVFLRIPSGSTSAIVHKFAPDDIDEAQRAFNDLGPTARLCISFVENPDQLHFYESRRRFALADFTPSDLIKALKDNCDLELNASHPLLLIRRVELNPWDTGYLQHYALEPITSYVRQELRSKLMEATQEERLHLDELFTALPQFRQRGGVAVGSMALQLQKDVALPLVSLVRQPPT